MSSNWISELEMVDPNLIQPYQMDYPFDYSLDTLLSCDNSSSYSTFDVKREQSNMTSLANAPQNKILETPSKMPKISSTCNSTSDGINPMVIDNARSSSQIICFEKSNTKFPPTYSNIIPKKEVDLSSYTIFPVPSNNLGNGRGFSSYKTPLSAQEHVIAERKRRKKLSQRFIALSTIIPHLKKPDKASILGEAIRHVNELKERVKKLEQQTAKSRVESVVFVRKPKYSAEGDVFASDVSSDTMSGQPLPEIEARATDKDVLIRIHCENHKGVAVKMLSEMEKLHLNVINSSVLPFGSSILDITIVAQMDIGFCLTMNDLVRNLREALLSSTDMLI